ncbi:MAG TPA: NAD(P)/FAD-dependent oxidoreductase [Nannocystaceae bacterium]|nr:NAD(P)/FAD-dependent oxidoreductase [Nannocystaceae bacterium]
MAKKHIVVVGGGLAGLSTACYALVNGWEVTIVEHNLALGGVCTAWRRGPYLVDGCIHWLTGGPFAQIYEELQIVPPVQIQVLEQFMTYRHRDGWSVALGRDLEALRVELRTIAPEDGEEIDRMIAAAHSIAELPPGIDKPPEITSMREQVRAMWAMRHELGTIVHFRGSVREWVEEHIRNERLRAFFRRMMPLEAPMLFALMIFGYLARGWLSRPLGGTAPFRDALIDRFRKLGGRAMVGATVDEILVQGDRVRGVRLSDGSDVDGDIVVSTSSAPETVLRLLGGRYGASDLRRRLSRWKLFDPIVLATFGVELDLRQTPSTLIVDGVPRFAIGGRADDHLYVRVYNDDPSFAPPGHSVVQLMLATDYDWWAARGHGYAAAKDDVGERALDLLDAELPGVRAATRMTDVATPLTFWRATRSWRGAFEGWQPTPDSFFGHVPKTLPGLDGLFLAGQWVEPGGGVPTALMSGRQLVQILCDQEKRPFTSA